MVIYSAPRGDCPLPICSPTISRFVRSKAGSPSAFELGAAGAGPTHHRSWDRARGVCHPRTTRKTCIQKNRFSLRRNLGVDQRCSTHNSVAVEACHSPGRGERRVPRVSIAVDTGNGHVGAKIGQARIRKWLDEQRGQWVAIYLVSVFQSTSRLAVCSGASPAAVPAAGSTRFTGRRSKISL